MTLAERAAKALERKRKKFLGAGATLTLYDNAGAQLATFTHSFHVERESNIVIGEEYHEAEISELAGMTQAISEKVKTARLSTMAGRFTASQGENAATAWRTWKLRLTPYVKS